MSGQSPPGSPAGPQRRRSSFAELFTSRPTVSSSTTPPSPSPSSSLPRAQHSRGMSVSTSTKGLGLTGISPDASPFTAFAKHRQASASASSGTGSPEFRNSFGDEPAVLEEDDSASGLNAPPSPSFARRMSFGAQALRDVKQGSTGGSGGGRRPSSSLFPWKENTAPGASSPSPPGPSKAATARGKGRGLSYGSSTCTKSPASCTACPPPPPPPPMHPTQNLLRVQLETTPESKLTASTGEGFNWSDALRDKTKRSPSFSASAKPVASNPARNRSGSITAPEPPKEMPKPAAVPPKFKKPDHLGERMLRGDFMMD